MAQKYKHGIPKELVGTRKDIMLHPAEAKRSAALIKARAIKASALDTTIGTGLTGVQISPRGQGVTSQDDLSKML